MSPLKENYDKSDFPIEVDLPFHGSINNEDEEEDEVYFCIDDIGKLIDINRLAAEFYSMNGRIFLPDMDFYGSTHPEERHCFYKACLAFYYVDKIKVA